VLKSVLACTLLFQSFNELPLLAKRDCKGTQLFLSSKFIFNFFHKKMRKESSLE